MKFVSCIVLSILLLTGSTSAANSAPQSSARLKPSPSPEPTVDLSKQTAKENAYFHLSFDCTPFCWGSITPAQSSMGRALSFYASFASKYMNFNDPKLYGTRSFIGEGGGPSSFVIFSDASQPDSKLRIIRRGFGWMDRSSYGVDATKDSWLPNTALSKFGNPDSINYQQSYNFYNMFLNYKEWTVSYFGGVADPFDPHPNGTKLCPGVLQPDSPASFLEVFIWQYSDRESSFLDMWLDLKNYPNGGLLGIPSGHKKQDFLIITDTQRISKLVNDLIMTRCTLIPTQ